MNYSDLVKKAAKETKLTHKTTKRALDLFLLKIRQELDSSGKSRITGFGTFKSKMHKAREVIIPGTLEKKFKTSHYSVHFTPDRIFKRKFTLIKNKAKEQA